MCFSASASNDLVGDVVGRDTFAELHDGHDFGTPFLRRATGDGAVVHIGVMPEGLFDFFGEDLLAARVDRDRVAAVQLDDVVDGETGAVTWYRVTHAVDDRECLGRLLGVAEITKRNPAHLGEPADFFMAGLEHRGHLGDRRSPTPGPGVNVPVVDARAGGHVLIWVPVSDEPTASMIILPGNAASRRSLIVEFSGAPPEMMANSDDRS